MLLYHLVGSNISFLQDPIIELDVFLYICLKESSLYMNFFTHYLICPIILPLDTTWSKRLNSCMIVFNWDIYQVPYIMLKAWNPASCSQLASMMPLYFNSFMSPRAHMYPAPKKGKKMPCSSFHFYDWYLTKIGSFTIIVHSPLLFLFLSLVTKIYRICKFGFYYQHTVLPVIFPYKNTFFTKSML